MTKLSTLAPVIVGSILLAWAGCSSQFQATTTTGGGGSASSTGAGQTTGASTGATTGATASSSTGTGGGKATPLFETDIVPIFDKSCGAGDNSCHSAVAYAASKDSACRGWLALTNVPLGAKLNGGPDDGKPTGCPDLPLYERLTQLDAWQECNGNLKKYIAPCDVAKSYLFDKIDEGPYCTADGQNPSAPMPKGTKMDPVERETLRSWILAGAPRVGGGGTDCNGSGGAGGADGGTPMIGQAPTASIWHPGDLEMRPANLAIPFKGIGTDPEDGDLSGASLVWTSSLSGMIGIGKSFDAPLGVGTHVITLTVTDSNQNQATDSITLFIQ